MAKKPATPTQSENTRLFTMKQRQQAFSKIRGNSEKDYRVIDPDKAEESTPYGLLTLDEVCGLGGIKRRGRVIDIHGEEHSGKSTLTYTITANYQRLTGEPVVIFDFERTGSWDYLHQIGVDDSLCELYQPDAIQDAEKRTLEFMKAGVRLFIFDSIVRMREEVDEKAIMSGDAHKTTPGEHARAMEKFFNNMLTPAARHDCVFLMVNQVRARIEATQEAMYAQKYPSFTNLPYVLPGGKTCRFTPSVMIETKAHKAVRAGGGDDEFLLDPAVGTKDKEDHVATRVKVRILKNKANGGGYREGAMYMRPGLGFDDRISIREYARDYGLIASKGAKWFVGTDIDNAIATYPNKEAAIEDLVVKQNPQVLEKLRALVVEAVRNDNSGRHTFQLTDHEERYMTGVDDDHASGDVPKAKGFEVEEAELA